VQKALRGEFTEKLVRLLAFKLYVLNFKSCLQILGLLFVQKVNLNCWNQTKEIQDYLLKENKAGTEEEFLDLWGNFQEKAYNLAVEANNNEVVTLSILLNLIIRLILEQVLAFLLIID